jgi:5'-nucleotidase
MTLSGAELLALLEDQQRPGQATPYFLIPSASLTYEWHARAAHGQRVRELRVDGQPVQPQRSYRFAVNNFLAEGGDRMTGLRQGRERVGGMLDVEALGAYLLAQPRGPERRARVTLVD